MENQLTSKDLELLEKIEKQYVETGFPFSLAISAELMGMSKGSVIADMVKRLEAAGVIEYTPSRSYFLPKRWRELVGAGTVHVRREFTEEEIAEMVEEIRSSNPIILPDPNTTPEFESLQAEADELRAEVERKDKLLAAAKKKIEDLRAKASTPPPSADLEKIRQQNRERQAAFQKRKREAREKAKQ